MFILQGSLCDSSSLLGLHHEFCWYFPWLLLCFALCFDWWLKYVLAPLSYVLAAPPRAPPGGTAYSIPPPGGTATRPFQPPQSSTNPHHAARPNYHGGPPLPPPSTGPFGPPMPVPPGAPGYFPPFAMPGPPMYPCMFSLIICFPPLRLLFCGLFLLVFFFFLPFSCQWLSKLSFFLFRFSVSHVVDPPHPGFLPPGFPYNYPPPPAYSHRLFLLFLTPDHPHLRHKLLVMMQTL